MTIDFELWRLLLLVLLIYLAGIIDSVAGGGGLISMASYQLVGLTPVYTLGNNKFGSTFGTGFAMGNYLKHGNVEWRSAITAALSAFIGSLIGAQLALRFSDYYFRYLMLVLVPVIGVMIFLKKDLYVGKRRTGLAMYLIAIAFGIVIGIYDGFFGPGTGMFLTLSFTAFLGLDTLTACGNTKIVNFSSNVAALLTYIISGKVIYLIGIPCAIASILGNLTGSSIAIRGGGKIVRPMVLVALVLLMINIISSFF